MSESAQIVPVPGETAVFEVHRSRRILTDPDSAWQWLTSGERLCQWFADSADLEEGCPFRFAFGDGDYFAGRVVEERRPEVLRLEWRFMDLGIPYEIVFRLEAGGDGEDGNGEGTLVHVIDRGATSRAEAEGLEWGWGDFFDRLERAVRTGERTRYRWSEEVALGALAAHDPMPSLGDPAWWQRAFPTATVHPLPTESSAEDGRIRRKYRFEDPAWGDHTTTATVSYRTGPDRAAVTVGQKGFDALPEEIQVAERARYAEQWRLALTPFEGETR